MREKELTTLSREIEHVTDIVTLNHPHVENRAFVLRRLDTPLNGKIELTQIMLSYAELRELFKQASGLLGYLY